MLFLKFLSALWLVYLSWVFVRSFKESLRRERQRHFGGHRPGAQVPPPGGRNPFGPFGPFGPQQQFDPFEQAARAHAKAQQEWAYQQARARSQPPPAAASRERSAYEVLQVSPGASDKEVRRAYQELMRKYHPDRMGAIEGLPQDLKDLAEQRTKEITAAYNTLKKKGL